MDMDEIHDAIHGIAMMVLVLLDAQDSIQAPDGNPRVFQVSREDGEMLSFAAHDIHKRVQALREALDRPTAAVIRLGGEGA